MAAAGAIILFSKNKDDLRINDLVGATIKMAILTSSYTPNSSETGHSIFSEVSGNEVSTTTTGYTAGGAACGSPTATAITNGFKFSTASPQWTAGASNFPVWRYGVLYVVGSLWGMTNPLIGYFLGDSTPADVPVTTSGNTLTINCPAAGWFDLV